MTHKLRWDIAVAAAGLLTPAWAHAATAPGQAGGTIADSTAIVATGMLNFGTFVRPASAGSIAVSTAGAVTVAGGLVGLTGVAQSNGSPQPASFKISGDASRFVFVAAPTAITITKGAASMNVNNITQNGFLGFAVLDAAGKFDLVIGGQLNVAANQAVGTYQGNFTVTVTYF